MPLAAPAAGRRARPGGHVTRPRARRGPPLVVARPRAARLPAARTLLRPAATLRGENGQATSVEAARGLPASVRSAGVDAAPFASVTGCVGV